MPFNLNGPDILIDPEKKSPEERAILDRYHHLHGRSGMCALFAS
jgi:hypothetical protein